MDQKLQVHKEPLNQPNLQLMLYALNERQSNGLDHLKQQYEHDTMVTPYNNFLFKEK